MDEFDHFDRLCALHKAQTEFERLLDLPAEEQTALFWKRWNERWTLLHRVEAAAEKWQPYADVKEIQANDDLILGGSGENSGSQNNNVGDLFRNSDDAGASQTFDEHSQEQSEEDDSVNQNVINPDASQMLDEMPTKDSSQPICVDTPEDPLAGIQRSIRRTDGPKSEVISEPMLPQVAEWSTIIKEGHGDQYSGRSLNRDHNSSDALQVFDKRPEKFSLPFSSNSVRVNEVFEDDESSMILYALVAEFQRSIRRNDGSKSSEVLQLQNTETFDRCTRPWDPGRVAARELFGESPTQWDSRFHEDRVQLLNDASLDREMVKFTFCGTMKSVPSWDEVATIFKGGTNFVLLHSQNSAMFGTKRNMLHILNFSNGNDYSVIVNARMNVDDVALEFVWLKGKKAYVVTSVNSYDDAVIDFSCLPLRGAKTMMNGDVEYSGSSSLLVLDCESESSKPWVEAATTFEGGDELKWLTFQVARAIPKSWVVRMTGFRGGTIFVRRVCKSVMVILAMNCVFSGSNSGVLKSLISWNVEDGNGSCYLYASRTADLLVTDDRVQGYDAKIKLQGGIGWLPQYVIEKFPHVQHYKPFFLPPDLDVRNLLKCQLDVTIFSSDGKCLSKGQASS